MGPIRELGPWDPIKCPIQRPLADPQPWGFSNPYGSGLSAIIKFVIFIVLSLCGCRFSVPPSGALAPSSNHFHFLCSCVLCAGSLPLFLLDIQPLVYSMNELDRSPRPPASHQDPHSICFVFQDPSQGIISMFSWNYLLCWSSCFPQSFPTVMSPGLSLFSLHLAPLAMPHRHARRDVSLVFLSLVMLTITMNHHTLFGYFVGWSSIWVRLMLPLD